MANLSNAVLDKLHFAIRNYGANAATVALFTGNLPTRGIELSFDNDEVAGAVAHNHDISALIAAGYNADVILDDMTAAEEAAHGVVSYNDNQAVIGMWPVNKALSLGHQKEYLKHNPRWVKQLTLICDDQSMFEGQMSLATLSPFHKENERDINLSQYFSVNQYQGSKIVIPFPYNSEEGLQINDNLLWTIGGIPGANNGNPCTLTVICELY